MKKIKTWMYYTFSGTCFTISGVINYTEGSYIRSTFLIIFSACLFGLAFINYKKENEVIKPLTKEDKSSR